MQEGREKGFKTGVDAGELEAESNKLRFDLLKELEISTESYQVLKSLVLGNNDVISATDNTKELANNPDIVDRVKHIESLNKKVELERYGVADAPFKKEGWMSLSMKRAVVDAAENDYEAIAWPDVEVMVDKYSEKYRELYTNIYNKKMPSIIKKLTGQEVKHLDMDGRDIQDARDKFIEEVKSEIKEKGHYIVSEGEEYIESIREEDGQFEIWTEETDSKHEEFIRSIPSLEDYFDKQNISDKFYPSKDTKGYFIVELTDELKRKVKDEGFTLFQKIKSPVATTSPPRRERYTLQSITCLHTFTNRDISFLN